MKQRFILFRRAGTFYAEDTTTRKQTSLHTKEEAEALTLLHSMREAHRQPSLNLQIARTYLTATDPEIAKRKKCEDFEEFKPMIVENTSAARVATESFLKSGPCQ